MSPTTDPAVAIARVAERRRQPAACLYAPEPADTDEHVIAEAVGGRLTAPILCGAHNNTIAATADKPLAEHYAPLTFAASVKRQRGGSAGKTGTTLRFIAEDGRPTTVAPDGRSEFGFEKEVNDAGVVQRASGPLRALAKIAKHHPDPNGFRLFAVASPGVTIPVEIGIGPETLPGYLKTALHFAAGFIAAPAPATIDAVRPGIFRERPVRVLMQLPFREPFFDPTGPIRHEVTLYPNGANAVVTIMLFSSFCVTMELPYFATRTALRYIQLLDGTGPQLVDVEPLPIPNHAMSERDWDQLLAVSRGNIERIFHERQQRDTEEIAQECGRTALGQALRAGNDRLFPYFFRAELERVPLEPRELIDDLVNQAQAHIKAGRNPLDLGPMLLS
jgi:hypothetical protein